VTQQITNHINNCNLGEVHQSAYKAFTSTETALLKVKSDVLNAVDKQEVVLLVLLDLSAAFDTIDHDILLQRLRDRLGISGNALQWVRTYLKCRSSRVYIDGSSSESSSLVFGVPQGSVIGPLLFVIYTLPVGEILRKHNIQFHVYADDTQLYVSFNPKIPGAAQNALRQLENGILELQTWMNSNKLKLNSDKTEFFIAGSNHGLKHLPPLTLQVGQHVINPSATVRNLGVFFDNQMSMTRQVNSIISSVNLQLRNIKRIQRFLNQTTKHQVVRALILSRMDYCNSLLYGIQYKDLRRLQSLQHKAAKLIFNAPRRSSPRPLMHTLHWLPIANRITYKICLLVFKCLNKCAPSYLNNAISLKSLPPHGPITRSSSDKTLLTVRIGKKIIGDKSFTAAGPAIWNNLPRTIRESTSITVFKKLLKTHLYRLH
jgi:hypothetical protein